MVAIYFALAILAYVYFSYLVVTHIVDGWDRGDPLPLIIAFFFALLGAMLWPVTVAIIFPVHFFYYRKK